MRSAHFGVEPPLVFHVLIMYSLSQHMKPPAQHYSELKYSNAVIAHWEKQNKASISDTKHKSKTLRDAITLCGISSSKKSVMTLRIYLQSLKKVQLPTCKDEVNLMLKEKYNLQTGGALVTNDILLIMIILFICFFAGPGLRSPQQRSESLLKFLDHTLAQQLGHNTIGAHTGDYKWGDHLQTQLTTAISAYLAIWVIQKPPFGYDTNNVTHMELWKVRRRAGLLWVTLWMKSPVTSVVGRICFAIVRSKGNSVLIPF